MQWTVITENSPMPASWQVVLVTVELVSEQKVRTLHTDFGVYMPAPTRRKTVPSANGKGSFVLSLLTCFDTRVLIRVVAWAPKPEPCDPKMIPQKFEKEG